MHRTIRPGGIMGIIRVSCSARSLSTRLANGGQSFFCQRRNPSIVTSGWNWNAYVRSPSEGLIG